MEPVVNKEIVVLAKGRVSRPLEKLEAKTFCRENKFWLQAFPDNF